jgi:hypothetical protein
MKLPNGKNGKLLVLDDEGRVLFQCLCSQFEYGFETFEFKCEGYQQTFHKTDENGHSILKLEARVPAGADGMISKEYV